MIPGKRVNGWWGNGPVSGAKRVVVLMTHNSKSGARSTEQCDLPLTGAACVNRVVTDLATIDVTARGFELVDVADGHTADEVQALTGAVLR